MKRFLIPLALILSVIMVSPVLAFESGTFRLGAGTGFVTGSGFSSTTLDPDNGDDVDVDTLAINGGYFLTDTIELNFQYGSMSIEDADIDIMGIAGKYYWPFKGNSFFAGGGLQTLDFDGADGDALYVTGGYNYMLRNYFSIDFYITLGQGDIEGDDFTMTDIGITYSVYFF